MATMSMASYPHIETNVIDESIYQYSNTRILPLQRDLFTIRAQKGRVGVLAWYDQYIEAERALGAETFNELNSTYYSNDALFVKNVMTNNGCFIVRLAEKAGIDNTKTHDGITERTGSIKALQILEAVVKCDANGKLGSDVIVYERSADGAILRDEAGNKIPVKLDATGKRVAPYTDNPEDADPDNERWKSISSSEPYEPASTETGSITYTPVSGDELSVVATIYTFDGSVWKHQASYTPVNDDVIIKTDSDDEEVVYHFNGTKWVGEDNTTEYTPVNNDKLVRNGVEYTFNSSTLEWTGYIAYTPEVGDVTVVGGIEYRFNGEYWYHNNYKYTLNIGDTIVKYVVNTFDGSDWMYGDAKYVPVNGDTLTIDGVEYTFNGSSWVHEIVASNGKAGVKTIKGIEISWRWRYAYIPINTNGLTERESIENMRAYTTGVGVNTLKHFPMIAFEASSPGSWGNDNCLELYYDSSINDRDEVQLLGNVKYTLKPQYKVYGKSSIQSYFDMRGNNSVSFGMEPGKIDDRYMSSISFTDVLSDSYDEANPLPWDVTYFDENWKELCEAAQKAEKAYFAGIHDTQYKIIDVPTGRVMLTPANINDYIGRSMIVLDEKDAVTGTRRKITDKDIGEYVVETKVIVNDIADGIADSDIDGIWGADSYTDGKGNIKEYDELTEDEQAIFNEQTEYYNAQLDLASPWMINIVSGTNLDKVPYHAIVVSNDEYAEPAIDETIKSRNLKDGTHLYSYNEWKNADLVKDVIHYAHNGRDGSLDDWDHEQNIRNFYNLTYQYEDTWNPKNIVDRGRFPFNTIFDTGYSIDTKKTLCDFLTVREDVKVILSTQHCTKYKNAVNGNTMYPVLNTMAQDESIGQALQSRVQLMRESIVKGTACCRATIFAHAGYVFGNYKGIVPMTLWSAIKGSEHYNTTTMRGTCKGWPNSQCNIFKTLNWVAPDEAAHERHWNIGINYVQYYDMDNLHFPSIRTVYKYDTSVLLDDEFTDAIVFVKQAARDSWATYVGMDLPQAEYEALVNKDLTARLKEIFNGRYSFNVEAYQTAEEAKRGYVQHVAITIYAPAVKRVWLVDVVCRRENFDAAASEA